MSWFPLITHQILRSRIERNVLQTVLRINDQILGGKESKEGVLDKTTPSGLEYSCSPSAPQKHLTCNIKKFETAQNNRLQAVFIVPELMVASYVSKYSLNSFLNSQLQKLVVATCLLPLLSSVGGFILLVIKFIIIKLRK